MFSDQEYTLFCTQKRIRELVLLACREVTDNLKVFSSRDDNNPFCNRPQQGLFLVYSYGVPYEIWSPLGKYRLALGFSGLNASETIQTDLLKHVDMEVYTERKTSAFGDYGPVYSINSVDGAKLPPAIPGEARAISDGECRACKEKWQAMEDKYKTS